MGKPRKIKWKDKEIEVEDLDFDIINESPSEYKAEDGTIIRVRVVTTNIFRAVEEKTPDGDPLFIVRSNNVLSTK